MKIYCQQKNLIKGLDTIKNAIPRSATLPILKNVCLVARGEELKLMATDLETFIISTLDAQVEEGGSITVPARILAGLVKSLPDAPIEMSRANKKSLSVKCGGGETCIDGEDALDFPPVPEVKIDAAVAIEAQILKEAVTHVAFATATEEIREVLTGVYCEFEGDQVVFTAADGFRLATYTAPLPVPVEKRGMLIPARVLLVVKCLIAKRQELVGITMDQDRACFYLNGTQVITRLIQGNFPNYRQVIPKADEYTTRVTINTKNMLQALKTCAVFAGEEAYIIRLYITPGNDQTTGELTVSAQAEEAGSNSSKVDALVEGKENKIAFDVRKLCAVLSMLQQSQFSLEITTPSSPGVIRPVGMDNYIYALMPMFVEWK